MKSIDTIYQEKLAKLKVTMCSFYIALPAALIILDAVLMKIF